MLNPTNHMVKYIHRNSETKNPRIIFITIIEKIDSYLNTDRFLVLKLSNNFFKKLFVFFLTIAYYSTLVLCQYSDSISHAKEILA